MTSHKHLKDAVRARMARTGERYTTAHRHLAGAASPPHRRASSPATRRSAVGGTTTAPCSPTCWRRPASPRPTTVAPLDEPMVAGLAGGIGFMYFSFSYAGELPTMTIVPRIHPRPFLAGALERAGIAHRATRDDQRRQGGPGAGRRPRGRPHADLHRRPRRAGPPDLGRPLPGAEPYDVAVVGRRGRRAADRRRVPGAGRRPRRRVRRGARRPTARAGTACSSWTRRAAPVDLVPAIRSSRGGHRARPHRGRHARQLRRELRSARAGEVGRRRRPTGAAPRAGPGCSTAARPSGTRCGGCTTA